LVLTNYDKSFSDCDKECLIKELINCECGIDDIKLFHDRDGLTS